MHLIVYVSKMTPSELSAEEVVSDIVRSAKKKNRELGITGVLFYENGHFLQALEGDEAALKKVFNRIATDCRHDEVSKLVDETVALQSFSDWSLDTFFIDSPDLINTETIGNLHQLYARNFEMSSKHLIEFIKRMVDELDTFKILHKTESDG